MSTSNDNQAYILARKYGFLPAQKNAGSLSRPLDGGKYEPDMREGESIRSMILAAYSGRCNLLIQYSPEDLE